MFFPPWLLRTAIVAPTYHIVLVEMFLFHHRAIGIKNQSFIKIMSVYSFYKRLNLVGICEYQSNCLVATVLKTILQNYMSAKFKSLKIVSIVSSKFLHL